MQSTRRPEGVLLLSAEPGETLGIHHYQQFLQMALDWPGTQCQHLLLALNDLQGLESVAYRGLAQLSNAVLVQGGQVILVAAPDWLRLRLVQNHLVDCFLFADTEQQAHQLLRTFRW